MATFILDTNVLLHDARALYAFSDATVVIPLDVLEELDLFKKNVFQTIVSKPCERSRK